MCIKMRIQGLFRNVPASNSPPLASPILHFPPAGLILGWVPPISALDALTLRDQAPWMVMGNHRLCSWYRCTWLVLKHLCGYTQLLQWVSAMLLMVFFTGGSLGRPLNSSMDCPKRQKEVACVYPALARASSMSLNFPTSQPQQPIASLGIPPFIFRGTGTLRDSRVTWKFL